MRFRGLVVFLLVLVLSGAGYTVVSAGTTYFRARGLVERAVSDATGQRRVAAAAGMAMESAGRIRQGILVGAREHGLGLDEARLAVSESRTSVVVKIEWSQPLLPYGQSSGWVLPLSFEWAFNMP